jgi:hypothetical protein
MVVLLELEKNSIYKINNISVQFSILNHNNYFSNFFHKMIKINRLYNFLNHDLIIHDLTYDIVVFCDNTMFLQTIFSKVPCFFLQSIYYDYISIPWNNQ